MSNDHIWLIFTEQRYMAVPSLFSSSKLDYRLKNSSAIFVSLKFQVSMVNNSHWSLPHLLVCRAVCCHHFTKNVHCWAFAFPKGLSVLSCTHPTFSRNCFIRHVKLHRNMAHHTNFVKDENWKCVLQSVIFIPIQMVWKLYRIYFSLFCPCMCVTFINDIKLYGYIIKSS